MLATVNAKDKSDDMTIDYSSNRINYLIQKCALCTKAIDLRNGGTIYGENWYHNDCWALFKKTNLPIDKNEEYAC